MQREQRIHCLLTSLILPDQVNPIPGMSFIGRLILRVSSCRVKIRVDARRVECVNGMGGNIEIGRLVRCRVDDMSERGCRGSMVAV